VSERVFLDTNVLLYADDADAGRKRDKARAVIEGAIETGNGVLSCQVLQEYFVNATRKLGLGPAEARSRVDSYLALDVVTIRADLILGAIDLHRLHGFSFWDALILKCAAESGCDRLLTEDLQDERRVEGVQIENPFSSLR
jgi:predicted nucleic acid-binding protein